MRLQFIKGGLSKIAILTKEQEAQARTATTKNQLYFLLHSQQQRGVLISLNIQARNENGTLKGITDILKDVEVLKID